MGGGVLTIYQNYFGNSLSNVASIMNQGLHLNEKRGILLDSKSHFWTQNKAFPNYGTILMRNLHLEKYGTR